MVVIMILIIIIIYIIVIIVCINFINIIDIYIIIIIILNFWCYVFQIIQKTTFKLCIFINCNRLIKQTIC